ncbi:asparagine synthase-related protein [Halobacteria archaeon AArc-curdl1]|uniref:Asparagine synthase-related protein n=1 Tax=Natronosalvus hydrolyticus TaxID=2979988 RepID=A0AAP3E8B0_9EURY|nr:asparagine synthase-related protein [Halobacteria archaeon AArc-curdl1]
MRLGLLYSGGKDSTLAAMLLDEFYDVTVMTATFEITDDWKYARETAQSMGFGFERLELDRQVAEDAVDTIRNDGFPRNGIQRVHQHALERLAESGFDAIADGTRRDDRVPTVSRAQAQSLEDRHDVDYIAPLSGFGRRAVDRLVESTLDVTVGPSEEITRADYEAELRALLAEADGRESIGSLFPAHEQTYVTGFNDR